MAQGILINPEQVITAPGGFSVSSEGFVQGIAEDDPAIRYQLKSGMLDVNQTTPLWGGCAITESLPTTGVSADEVDSVIKLATSAANVTGFTVFNQSLALYQSPSSPVPLAMPGDGVSKPGGFINFYRLGTRARIAVQVDSGVAAALAGGAINQAAYWDYTNQKLLNAPGGTAIPVKVIRLDKTGNSRTVSYNGTSGFAIWNDTGYTAVIEI